MRLFFLFALFQGCHNGEGSAPLTDLDGDGYTTQEGDCDDSNASVYPGATDSVIDGTDNNCDGIDGVDNDQDGYASVLSGGNDCRDKNPDVHPGAEEVCDGRDNNCDGLIDDGLERDWFLDQDGDGYGQSEQVLTSCEQPEGYVSVGGDCNDDEYMESPGNTEDYCDGLDNDCDDLIDEDSKAGWELISLSGEKAYAIDPSNASMTEVANVSILGDFNSADSRELGQTIAHTPGGLFDVDICAESVEFVGETGTGNYCGISFGPEGKLYGITPTETGSELVTFDLVTGQASTVGSLGMILGYCGLSYDCTNDRLIGAAAWGNRIFEIDHSDGTASPIVDLEIPFYTAMGVDYDPQSRRLRVSNGPSLYEIDLVTGQHEKKGDFTISGVNDLALMQTCD